METVIRVIDLLAGALVALFSFLGGVRRWCSSLQRIKLILQSSAKKFLAINKEKEKY